MFSLSRSVKNTTASWTALEEEEDDDDEEEDNEEESPAYNLMVLPNAELCGLWSVLLFCEL